MKDFEYQGRWWLPGKDESWISGTLKYSNDEGIRLALDGSFENGSEGMLSEGGLKSYPVMLGMTKEGRPVTLLQCMQMNARYSFPGFPTEQYLAETGYLGAHFDQAHKIRFWKLEVRYSNLADWVGVSGFQSESSREEGRLKLKIKYSFPEETDVNIAGGKIIITFQFDRDLESPWDVRLQQSTLVRMEAQENLSMDEWFARYLRPFQDFLTLAMNKASSIKGLIGYNKEIVGPSADGSPRQLPVEIVFATLDSEPLDSKRLFPHDMLFTFPDIKADFQKIIPHWFLVAGDLHRPCELFFSIQYRRGAYLEHQFLTTVQALESYHRCRFKREVLPAEEHQKRVDAILLAVNERYRSWLREKLNYSNEPSLRQRLKELIGAANGVVSQLIPSREGFVQLIIDTRNYLTHNDSSLQKKAGGGEKLYHLTEVLSLLMQASFLNELGFPPGRSVQLFERNSHYQWVKSKVPSIVCSAS